jgi:hypothetical protein
LRSYRSSCDATGGILQFRDIQHCLQALFTALQSETLTLFNSAGKSLGDLMSSPLCLANVREEIRMFLANLEIYGSMPPGTCSDSKEFFITDYMQCRLLSLTQVSTCIKKLEEASSEDSTPAKKALFSNPLL